MVGQEEMRKNKNMWEACSRMCSRGSGAFWGVLFIVIGLYWLVREAHWLPAEFIELFWPALLVGLGLWFTVGALIRKNSPKTDGDK